MNLDLPYALDRMDFEWEDRFRDLGLTMKPSDDWRRQCKATFRSDYPHGNGVWPESSRYIEEQFGHLPPEITHTIVCGNTARFYGLIPSRILRRDRP